MPDQEYAADQEEESDMGDDRDAVYNMTAVPEPKLKSNVPIQMHEVDVSKYNERVKMLEKLRKETLRELIEVEDDIAGPDSGMDSYEARQRGAGRLPGPAPLPTTSALVKANVPTDNMTSSQQKLVKQHFCVGHKSHFKDDLNREASSSMLELANTMGGKEAHDRQVAVYK